MTRRKYTITIQTSRTYGVHEEKKGVRYPGMPKSSLGDTVRVYSQKIEIEAERNRKYNIDEIIEYKQNTLYMQIYKALLYLFLRKKEKVKINKIKIKRPGYSEDLCINAKQQPLSGKFFLRYPVPNIVLDILWEESVRGNSLRSAVSHFLVALSSCDRYKRFERFWRAFEQIFVWHKYHEHIPNKPKEFDALVAMRNYLCSNSTQLQSTFNYVGNLDSAKIGMLHWKKLILSNYSSRNKTQLVDNLYNDFFQKNKDERLDGIFRKVLNIYRKDIENQGRMQDFETLINTYKNTHVRNNAHVLSLIACKYCYFMRNKMFHGEVADFSFCFTNHTEDDDITDFLNGLLEMLVNELICKYNEL